MQRFFRRQLTIFLVGFVISFVIFLFIRFNADAVFLGMAIGAGVGVATCFLVAFLNRKFFNDEPAPAVTQQDT